MALLLKDFTGIEKLGNGGMGEVFTAFQVSLKRKVVLKKMTQSSFSNQFEEWVKLAASLDHDNVVHIYDFGTENGEEYFTMEYIEGSDLEKLLARKQFPREIGLMIALQALKGLYFLHQKGLVHGDFKPNNILVSKNGMVKVADFGLASAPSQTLSLSNNIPCFITPAYMPPEAAEQIVKLELSHNSLLETTPITKESIATNDTFEAMNISGDIWCAGVLLYRILCGKLPFSGETFSNLFQSIINSREPDFLHYVPFLPGDLANAITSCFNKDPKSRLSSLYPLITSLEFIISDMGLRDIEKEIGKYMVDENSAIYDLERILLKYHDGMAKKYWASGDTDKGAAHYAEFNKLEQKGKYAHWVGSTTKAESSFSNQAANPLLNRLKKCPKIPTILTDTLNALLYVTFGIYSYLTTSRAPKIVFTVSMIIIFYFGIGFAVYSFRFPKNKIHAAEMFTSTQTVDPGAAKTAPTLQTEVKPEIGVPDRVDQVQVPVVATVIPIQNIHHKKPKPGIAPDRKNSKSLISGKKPVANPVTKLAADKSSFTVESGVTRMADIVLTKAEKAVGLLHVYSYPWSDLYVDGILQGTTPTPKPLAFPEGEHALQLKHQGFKPYSGTVSVQKDLVTRVQVTLEKSELSER